MFYKASKTDAGFYQHASPNDGTSKFYDNLADTGQFDFGSGSSGPEDCGDKKKARRHHKKHHYKEKLKEKESKIKQLNDSLSNAQRQVDHL